MLKKASEILAAMEIICRDEEMKELAFSSRPFVVNSFPAKRISGSTWKRTNGNSTLTISVPEGEVIPFGMMDRLVPIFLATRAVQTKARTIEFDSAKEILDFFGMAHDGPSYRRLTQSLNRVFNASVFFTVESKTHSSKARFNFLSGLSLWKKDSESPRLFRNQIVLSADFFEEIIKHPIPLDLAIVRLLRSKPFTLDLYMFLSYRVWGIKKTLRITLAELAHALGSRAYGTNPTVFRKRFRAALDLIVKLTEMNVRVEGETLILAPGICKRIGPG